MLTFILVFILLLFLTISYYLDFCSLSRAASFNIELLASLTSSDIRNTGNCLVNDIKSMVDISKMLSVLLV